MVVGCRTSSRLGAPVEDVPFLAEPLPLNHFGDPTIEIPEWELVPKLQRHGRDGGSWRMRISASVKGC